MKARDRYAWSDVQYLELFDKICFVAEYFPEVYAVFLSEPIETPALVFHLPDNVFTVLSGSFNK